MGWPSADPEGWAEVERDSVSRWLFEQQAVYSTDNMIRQAQRNALVLWLQAEQGEIFHAMLVQVSPFMLSDAEADYLERKFSTGDGL